LKDLISKFFKVFNGINYYSLYFNNLSENNFKLFLSFISIIQNDFNELILVNTNISIMAESISSFEFWKSPKERCLRLSCFFKFSDSLNNSFLTVSLSYTSILINSNYSKLILSLNTITLINSKIERFNPSISLRIRIFRLQT